MLTFLTFSILFFDQVSKVHIQVRLYKEVRIKHSDKKVTYLRFTQHTKRHIPSRTKYRPKTRHLPILRFCQGSTRLQDREIELSRLQFEQSSLWCAGEALKQRDKLTWRVELQPSEKEKCTSIYSKLHTRKLGTEQISADLQLGKFCSSSCLSSRWIVREQNSYSCTSSDLKKFHT